MCKNKNGPKKDWLFQPTYNPPWPICKHLINTLKKIDHPSNFLFGLRLPSNSKVPIFPAYHSTRLLYIKASFPPQWVHGTPKSAIFIGFFITHHPFWGSSHPHPGPIPFIPFIRDPGPNPNPMILPHVLELNGSKKLPNLRGGIFIGTKRSPFWPDDDMREKVVQNVCLLFVYFFFLRSMEVVDWGGSNFLEAPLLGQCKEQQEDNHIDV